LSKKRNNGADEITEDAEEYLSVSCFLTVIDTAKLLSNEVSKLQVNYLVYYIT
jgi:spore coat protein CotH